MVIYLVRFYEFHGLCTRFMAQRRGMSALVYERREVVCVVFEQGWQSCRGIFKKGKKCISERRSDEN